MKIVIQRVSSGKVVINGDKHQSIGAGLIALVALKSEDSHAIVDYMIDKMINLRIFDDENNQLNHSLLDINGEIMIVPNFTLYANAKKGRRPSFVEAAPPSIAVPLYEYTVEKVKRYPLNVVTGEFGADMLLTINNYGPITIVLDSDDIVPEERKNQI